MHSAETITMTKEDEENIRILQRKILRTPNQSRSNQVTRYCKNHKTTKNKVPGTFLDGRRRHDNPFTIELEASQK